MPRYSKIAALALPPLILTLALFVFMQATAPACPSCEEQLMQVEKRMGSAAPAPAASPAVGDEHVLVLADSVNAKLLPANNRDIEPGQYRELDITLPPFGVQGVKELLYMANKHMHQVVHIDNTVQ